MNKETLTTLPIDLQNSSVELNTLGLNEVAWPRPQVLKVIEWCKNQNYVILGGDVFLFKKNIEYAYANWAIEAAASDEISPSLITSSYEKAYNYITHYKEIASAKTLYSVVVTSLTETVFYRS